MSVFSFYLFSLYIFKWTNMVVVKYVNYLFDKYLFILYNIYNVCVPVARNYEHIVKAHQSTPLQGQNQLSDEVKFQVVSHHSRSLFF